MSEESSFSHHEACPACGSSDGLARYTDGGGHCFVCTHHEGNGKEYKAPEKSGDWTPVEGVVAALTKRKISEATCRKFGYRIGTASGTRVQIADIRNSQGNLEGQKLRDKDKNFLSRGTVSDSLFGMHLWQGGRKLVITEGEIDALSYAEVTGCKYPVVSIPCGVQSAKKILNKNMKWLLQFQEIILMFDGDDVGKAAAAECAPLFPPNRVKTADLGQYKDANEVLQAGEHQLLVNSVFNAKDYKPSAIVTVDDIFDLALQRPEMGLSLPWPSATDITLGIRKGEIHIVGAAPKIGKTEHQHQLIRHMTEAHGEVVGVMSLEEKPVKTLKKIAGKYMGQQFTKPPEVAGWKQEDLVKGLNLLKGKIQFYSSEGVRDADEILSTVRYWAACGMWFFIIDPLTALVAEHDSSAANDILNDFMSKAASMCQELDITFFMYSHVNPPKTGLPHDQGGEVLSSQFTGSRAMEKWAHYGWGIVRNRNEEDKIKRNTGEIVLLFDREYGEYCRYPVFYDSDTNDFREIDPMEAAGFQEEELEKF